MDSLFVNQQRWIQENDQLESNDSNNERNNNINNVESAAGVASWNEDFSHRPSWCDAKLALIQIKNVIFHSKNINSNLNYCNNNIK